MIELDRVDLLVADGVRHRLGPLQTSRRLSMRDDFAQALFDNTAIDVARVEVAVGRALHGARAELDRIAGDPWARVTAHPEVAVLGVLRVPRDLTAAEIEEFRAAFDTAVARPVMADTPDPGGASVLLLAALAAAAIAALLLLVVS